MALYRGFYFVYRDFIVMSNTALKIAIVDDSKEDIDHCVNLLERFSKETGQEIEASTFLFGDEFLEKFKSQYDIIFLDVNLGSSNGIEIAKKIRAVDEDVVLFFVTNLSRYATEGYVVHAFDYVLKPLTYESFYLKIDNAVRALSAKKESASIIVPTKAGFTKVVLDDTDYVEIFSHDVVFHGPNGDVTTTGTLKTYEQKLAPYDFIRCNSCYLVNAKRIVKIFKYQVFFANGEFVEISHPKKKKFIQEFKDYIIRTGK